jgi:hypothetical protein
MSDRSGQARALTALVPISEGREQALRAYLRALPRGARSPLARLSRTHFARWVVIDRLPADVPEPEQLGGPYLLFTSNLDGDVESYLEELCARIPEEAREIWGCCAGFPGVEDTGAFTRWLLDHHLTTSFFVPAYGRATVERVRGSLAARDELLRFVLRSQDLAPAERLDAFRAVFPS